MSKLFATAGLVSGLVLAACGPSGAQTPTPGEPLETRPPNGDYPSAFPGQTRAPYQTDGVAFTTTVVVQGLELPWALEVLPDGRYLVTERPGRMRIVGTDGSLSEPVEGLPEVVYEGQGGLLDVALAPDFAESQLVYWSYAEPREDGANGTSVARGRLVADGATPRLENVEVVYQQQPAYQSPLHFGSRIAFAPDGTMFVTQGERFFAKAKAQDLSEGVGKVVRINPDGSIPADNPFVDQEGARPEIWSYGHRNMQGAAIHPETGQLWTVEHGPRGGDELNHPEAGKNYGWPVIVYGIDYSGQPEGDGITQHEGMEQPVYYWDPVIAPSGLLFYTGDMFPAWRGDAFIGGLGSQKLVRLELEGERVTAEEWLLTDRGARFRDVKQAPDGALLLVNEQAGEVLRVAAE